MRIVAIVVTFNRPRQLEKSIRAIYAGRIKPHGTVIIDNAPNLESRQVISRLNQTFDSIEVIEATKNLGGAGGFNLGLKVAYKMGAEFYWLMDDDAYCNTASLSKLVQAYKELSDQIDIGFLCSRVIWSDGQICHMNQPEPAWDWMRSYRVDFPVIKVYSCSFVSCFFSRKILKKVGLPFKEFFIWFDDVEFTTRISKKYPSYAVLNSVVTHDTERNQSASFEDLDDSNLWKFCYGAANESWSSLWQKSFAHWVLFWAKQNLGMQKEHVSMKNRVKINLAIFKGAMRRLQIEQLE